MEKVELKVDRNVRRAGETESRHKVCTQVEVLSEE